MPRNGPVFQDHHAIEQQTLRRSQLLKALSDAGHFDIHAPENRIFLPADPAFAQTLGVTPHSGGPIGDYQVQSQLRLRRLEQTPDGVMALAGDADAQERIAVRVATLRDTVRVGLIRGDLYTNVPLGLKADDIRPGVQSFFRNESAYGQIHATEIQGFKTYAPVDHGWAAVTHSEGRVVSTLQHIDTVPNALTRGGKTELQRHGLSQAISNAYHGGRLTLSPGGVAVVENTLGEEAARNLRVPRGQRGEVSMQLLMGEASARGLTRAGGLLTTGVDAVSTARTAAALMEAGNTTAAQSEIDHAIARNAGGWAGGASTAMALGSSTGFVPTALAVGDALLMSKAFDKAVDLKENRDIFHQTDKANVEWKFNGRNWEREATFAGSAGNAPAQGTVTATYEKSQELNAMANAKAAELALGKAPPPQDPFDLPAKPGDQIGLDNTNWKRNPATESWERQVKTSVSGANDRGTYEPQTASPEQAQRLNQEALGRIESNIANGREALAQAYLENHAAQRGQAYGVEVPKAVERAKAKPDQVQGHNGQTYQRSAEGDWIGKDGPVTGNLALELELTNQMRQPSLERSQEALAAIEARPAPTAAQLEHNDVLHRYRVAGVNIDAQEGNLQAVELATRRTREAAGLVGPVMQQLKRDEHGNYGYDSPIAHLQAGPDGVVRQVALTTSEELRQAKAELSQPPPAHVPTLGTVSVTPPGRNRDEADAQEPDKPAQSPVLADNPAHADHPTYQRIHSWVRGTGNWNEEECRNVTAALYKQQIDDPLIARVDQVTGALGKDGAHNVFAVYAPHGLDKGPQFHTHVDGRQAAQEPAQQNLQRAEVIHQETQTRQQATEQDQRQTQEQVARMTM